MASENPLLLIDSALPDVVGPFPRTSWFVLDAHHAIPFQQVILANNQVAYEAPPQFRARLVPRGGTWGQVVAPGESEANVFGWQVKPPQWDVYLYDGALHYTFVAIYHDVPPNLWNKAYRNGSGTPKDEIATSCHDVADYDPQGIRNPYDSVRNPGFGVPFYGLCVRIEDRARNTVEISYSSVTQTPIDRNPEDDCTECQQLCLRKGQISHIVLSAPDASGTLTAQWTLVYAHRYFRGLATRRFGEGWPPTELPTNADTRALLGSAAIDRIYVFAGSPITANNTGAINCVSLPAAIEGETSRELEPQAFPYTYEGDPLVDFGQSYGIQNPTNWVHQVQYHYRTRIWATGASEVQGDGVLTEVPLLIRTTVQSRRQSPDHTGIAGTERPRHTFFRYYNGEIVSPESDSAGNQIPHLQAVISPDEFDQLIEWARAGVTGNAIEAALAAWLLSGPDGTPIDARTFSVGDYALEGYGVRQPSPVNESNELLYRFASVHMLPKAWHTWNPAGDSQWPPAVTVLGAPFFGTFHTDDMSDAKKRLFTDGDSSRLHPASVVSINSGGSPRHFMLHRLIVSPHEIELQSSEDKFHLNGGELLASRPLRSIFANPYRWTTTGRVFAGPPDADKSPSLTEPRWIVMIDEFDTRESLISNASYAGDVGHKPGLLSRRVVHINAAGFVVRERIWKFASTGTIDSSESTGLGSETRYQSIKDYFDLKEIDVEDKLRDEVAMANPIEPPAGSGGPDDDTIDARKLRQIQTFLSQPLRIEYRTVGWSAVPTGQQGTEGAIRFFDYSWFQASSSNPPLPWTARVQLTGEGIKSGTDGARYFVRQNFRAASNPNDITTEVTFFTAAAGKATSIYGGPLPSAPSQNPVTFPPDIYGISRRVTTREDPTDTSVPTTERRVTQTIDIGPPRRLRPASAWYFPVRMQSFSTDNEPEWLAEGLALNPEEPNSGQGNDPFESLVLTYTKTLSPQERVIIIDAVQGSVQHPCPEAPTIDVPAPPPYWGRIPAPSTEDPALNYYTYFYSDDEGPRDIYYPNGRRFARRSIFIAPPPGTGDPSNFRAEPGATQTSAWSSLGPTQGAFRRDFIFNDLERSGTSPNQTWTPRSPGEIRDYASSSQSSRVPFTSGNPLRLRRVDFEEQNVQDFLLSSGQAGQPFFRAILEKKYRPDQYGRMAEADLFELDSYGAMSPVGSTHVNDLTLVVREREMDGTVTRVVRNMLGQRLRRYVGKFDAKWSNPDSDGVIPLGADNDLVLVERSEYGADSHSAWLPTIIRKYDTNEGASWAETPYGPAPTSDAVGRATVTGYDWRMRAVRVDVFDRGDHTLPATLRLQTTLTYLDHFDRAVLIVTYGSGELPSFEELEPTQRAPNDDPPTAKDLLSLSGMRPISVSGTIYSADGDAVERREYDVAWQQSSGPTDPPFHAAYEFKGQGGVTLFQQSPGQGTQISEVDGLGRVRSTATVLPRPLSGGMDYSLEVARTDFKYDADNNVHETARWERIVDIDTLSPGVLALDSSNAVRTTTVSWHDVQRRLVATADLGTESTEGFVCEGDPTRGDWYNAPGSAFGIHLGSFAVSLPTSSAIPAAYPLTVYQYDRLGRQVGIAESRPTTGARAFSVTKMEYTGSGSLRTKLENANAPLGERRFTQYQYRYGRLSEISANRLDASGAQACELQSTVVNFGTASAQGGGAEIVDRDPISGDTRIMSLRGGPVRSMHLPSPSSGTLSTSPAFLLRYDFQGRLAERTDARGVTMRYSYDGLDRLTAIEVGGYAGAEGTGAFTSGYPSSTLLAGGAAPVDRVGYVEFTYAPDMRSYEAKAYTALGGSLITATKLQHDPRGNLIEDWQALGAPIDSDTLKTAYSWDVVFTHKDSFPPGHTRLESMTYAAKPDFQQARVVNFAYGTAGHANDLTSRIASISTSTTSSPGGDLPIADFSYSGGYRRMGLALAGEKIVQDFDADTDPNDTDPGIGLGAYDSFGRRSAIHYRKASTSGDTLTRLDYTYDIAGNRATALRTPRPTGTGSGTNQKQENDYDRLQRLIGMSYSTDDSGSGGTHLHADEWNLDLLGNWSGHTVTPFSGSPQAHTHTVDFRNQIRAISPAPQPTSPDQQPVYDAAGNLIFDGTYAYQYDAWNRLVQVNYGHSDLPQAFGGTPGFEYEDMLVYPGDLVKHHTYDGLGRLVRTQSPYPEPGAEDFVRVERFYYDGIRRLQEVVTDPMLTLAAAMASGDPQTQALAQEAAAAQEGEPDASAAPILLEEGQLNSSVSELPAVYMYLDREYIWGPGDNGVDELLVQFDQARYPWWVAQDAGGDVIALMDLAGTGGAARVVGEWTYDAYGQVIESVEHHAHAPPRCGHKGLFFDRLDAGVTDEYGGEIPRLEPGATLLGYNRNRTLHAGWGRFLQRDPNGVAAPFDGREAFLGLTLGCNVHELEIGEHYADGAHPYQYVMSTPPCGTDPLGLFFSLGEVMGASGWQAELQEGLGDELKDVHQTLAKRMDAVFGACAIFQMADFEWAGDWSARDDDYTMSGGVDYFAPGEEEATTGDGHRLAVLSPTEESTVRVGARISNHGKAKHYSEMAVQTIDYLNKNGKSLSDVAITFNKSIPGVKPGGKALRPDVVIYDLRGNVLQVIEVGHSQSDKRLKERVKEWRMIFGSKVKSKKLAY